MSGEMPWACNRAKGAPMLMGNMDGQRRGAEELGRGTAAVARGGEAGSRRMEARGSSAGRR